MSHLFERLRPGTRRDNRRPTAPGWLVEAPSLRPDRVAADLIARWGAEFSGAPLVRRLAFSTLRLLQHVAYRRGYGGECVRAQVPPIRTPDFSSMANNLAELLPESRGRWLNAFLGSVNAPAPAPELPHSVVLELSATCNYACEDCGVGAHGLRHDRMMSLENLRRWAAQACGNASVIRINGLGEATLHPDLQRCVEILGAYPGGREIITNLSAPVDTYRMLLDAGFLLLVSWDAARAKTFERIRKHARFDELERKLPLVAGAALATRAPPPVLLFTLRPGNISELEDTVALASANGISRVTVNVLRTDSGEDWTASYRDAIRRAFDDAATTAARHGVALLAPDHLGGDLIHHSIATRSSDRGCSFPWTQAVIRWDGRVSVCNMMNPYLHGDLQSLPFREIWAGPTAQCFRALANGPDRHPYCRGCYYVHGGGELIG